MNKKQFFYLLNNSLKITLDNKPNSIFYVWNQSIDRQLKYNRLFNKNNPIKYKFNQNDILFELNQNMYLWYDYDNIHQKLNENSEYKDLIIKDLIDGWLKDDTNWKLYTPSGWVVYISNLARDCTITQRS
jgi:hypothetical protein